MRRSFITGADDHLIGNLFMLLDSFARQEQEETLHVCDFGFSPEVRRFLERIGVLLRRPSLYMERDHPWYAKAGMVDFLPSQHVDAFVWIDADMILTGPVATGVDAQLAEMAEHDQTVALCRDECRLTLQEFIDRWIERGRDIEPFGPLLDAAGVDRARPYLNTGFLICRDLGFARAWRDLTLAQPVWLLFEQNCFNCLAHSRPDRVRLVDAAEWNVHAAALDDALTPANPSPRILHATSDGDRHLDGELQFGVGGKLMRRNLKLFLREELRNGQLEHLESFLERHFDALCETGLLR